MVINDVKGKQLTITRTFRSIQKRKELSFSSGDITIKTMGEDGKVCIEFFWKISVNLCIILNHFIRLDVSPISKTPFTYFSFITFF